MPPDINGALGSGALSFSVRREPASCDVRGFKPRDMDPEARKAGLANAK